LKKISKLPIFVQKYLINILAMLYVLPFRTKIGKIKLLFFREKAVFSRNVFLFIFYIISLIIFQNECQPFIFFISRKHDGKFEPLDPYIFVKTTPIFFFYFFGIPEIIPYKTPDLEYVNFATPCILF
jgi:hypothetical protein